MIRAIDLVFHEENDFAAERLDDISSLFFIPMAENFHQVEVGIL